MRLSSVGTRRLLAIGVAVGLLSSPSRARCETVTKVYGPLHLKGVKSAMAGPQLAATLKWDHPVWLHQLKTTVLDSRHHPVEAVKDVFCHSRLRRNGAGEDEFSLALNQIGTPDVTFPPGYGVRVASGTPYDLTLMLQSDDPAEDADYYFQVSLDVIDASAAALKALKHFTLYYDSPFVDGWNIVPGKHDYDVETAAPYSGQAHYVMTHLHPYATRLALKDATDNKVIYEAHPDYYSPGKIRTIPYYSSETGFPVVKGHVYRFEFTYDNPLRREIPGRMASMHIYVHAPD